jgi:hypothetical protein
MKAQSSFYANELRRELGQRNRLWARGRSHVESYGNPPVIVYAPEEERHGNFFSPAFAAIAARSDWMRRFDKIHAQGRSLPKPLLGRRWRELDSSMSSDALLMNVFCAPGVAESPAVRRALGIEGDVPPVFGWKARVPLANGRSDRTEVDMRWGGLLVESKLTEGDFQAKTAAVVEAYRDFRTVFDPELLPRVPLRVKRHREPTEFPEDYSQEQEYEDVADAPDLRSLENQSNVSAAEFAAYRPLFIPEHTSPTDFDSAYESYQLIRNVLAAFAGGESFCVIHDARRPDLREAWFRVMAAVSSSALRVRLKVLTWQELSPLLPEDLQQFLDWKYGIVTPGRSASILEEGAEPET